MKNIGIWASLLAIVIVPACALADSSVEEQNRAYYELLKKSDDAYRNKQWDLRADLLWQAAAIAPNNIALDNLSAFYNEWHFKSWYSWDIPHKYLQKVADHDFAFRQMEPRVYNGNFFIVAPEREIVERIGVRHLKKRYAKGCCSIAVRDLYKKYFTSGIDGKPVLLRAVEMDNLGEVAVLDVDSAKKLFRGTETVNGNIWTVLVKSPYDPETLIPFERFHKTVYERKMAAFLDICTYLGAEEISVTYLGDNQTTIAGGIRVDGSFAQKYTPSSAVKAQAIRNDKNAVIANIKLAGSLAPHKIKTHWFSDEPLWHSMYIARINKGIKTFDMEFKYDNDYKVNANVAAAFSNGAYSIGVDMSGEYANFVSQYWRFQVKFRPGVFVSLGPAVEIH